MFVSCVVALFFNVSLYYSTQFYTVRDLKALSTA